VAIVDIYLKGQIGQPVSLSASTVFVNTGHTTSGISWNV
jgi:hypothetical protein